MLKLNNKGYLTIEIILASVMAMVIAFFLIELTANLVNKTDDYNRETLFLTDKALITKNIKSKIEKDIKMNSGALAVSDKTDKSCKIGNKKIVIKDRNIIYTDETETINYYTKKLNDAVKGTITIKQCSIQDDYIVIQINVNDIFTDNNRDINIVVYNK